jgi:delta24(24(1))-sterol reductase
MVMIIHRTKRDIRKCRRKYGEAWTRYEREVPYLFIPVSSIVSISGREKLINFFEVCDLVCVGPNNVRLYCGDLAQFGIHT